MEAARMTADRYHDISCGHRVVGHEGKCRNLHGHNYRFHFKVAPVQGLDEIGRVLDFSVIKSTLCQWLEEEYDHKMLVWEKDPWAEHIKAIDRTTVILPFNPTAENLARYMVEKVGPHLLAHHKCVLVECRIEETRKCSATWSVGEKCLHTTP